MWIKEAESMWLSLIKFLVMLRWSTTDYFNGIISVRGIFWTFSWLDAYYWLDANYCRMGWKLFINFFRISHGFFFFEIQSEISPENFPGISLRIHRMNLRIASQILSEIFHKIHKILQVLLQKFPDRFFLRRFFQGFQHKFQMVLFSEIFLEIPPAVDFWVFFLINQEIVSWTFLQIYLTSIMIPKHFFCRLQVFL